MPSYSSVWIPALTVSHAVGFYLFLYAIQQNNRALTYWWWLIKYIVVYKRKFNGDFKKAWYHTYPGAKEAYDAANASKSVEAKTGDQTPEKAVSGPQPIVLWPSRSIQDVLLLLQLILNSFTKAVAQRSCNKSGQALLT